MPDSRTARLASGAASMVAAICGKVTCEILQVYVEMHGREPLHIDLPFGVDAQQGKAHHMDAEQRLILELPYKPYRSFTEVHIFCSLCQLLAYLDPCSE